MEMELPTYQLSPEERMHETFRDIHLLTGYSARHKLVKMKKFDGTSDSSISVYVSACDFAAVQGGIGDDHFSLFLSQTTLAYQES